MLLFLARHVQSCHVPSFGIPNDMNTPTGTDMIEEEFEVRALFWTANSAYRLCALPVGVSRLRHVSSSITPNEQRTKDNTVGLQTQGAHIITGSCTMIQLTLKVHYSSSYSTRVLITQETRANMTVRHTSHGSNFDISHIYRPQLIKFESRTITLYCNKQDVYGIFFLLLLSTGCYVI